MNDRKFDFLMHAVDEDLLEQAQQPVKRSRQWVRIAGAAAACAAVLVGVYFFRPSAPVVTPEVPDEQLSAPNTMVINPMRQVSPEELQQQGYTVPLPEGAENTTYFLISASQDEVPMAQVRFEHDGTEYTCRALKTAESRDISGLYVNWTQSLNWDLQSLQVNLNQADDNTAAISWYAESEGMQFSLVGGADALALLSTARQIANALGFNMDVSPAQATNVSYSALVLDKLEVGQTDFTLDGVHYTYRTAATMLIEEEFADISGVEGSFAAEQTGSVLWCNARLSFTEGGAGKIVWFDIAPGLLYSLHMDTGASAEALLEMAELLFHPTQNSDG